MSNGQPRVPPIVSVVARSKTDKTTFLEALIPALKKQDLSVAVVKHHHHTSSFDTPGKDTHRIAEAGADLVLGISPVQVATFSREDGSSDLDSVIARYCTGYDLVLTEGYKRGDFPKIEVHRAERSGELLCDFDEMLALVTDARDTRSQRRLTGADSSGRRMHRAHEHPRGRSTPPITPPAVPEQPPPIHQTANGLPTYPHTLTILRKGGNTVIVPLAPRTALNVYLAIGERIEGPIFLSDSGGRMNRHQAARVVRRLARHAGIDKTISPHSLRHSFITAALDAGVPLRDVQEAASHADPRTTMRYDRARRSLNRHATYIVATFVAGASR